MLIDQHTTEQSVDVLAEAAGAALRAPSILNTQPWRWRIHDSTAELRIDHDRQLQVIDPKACLATLSCGIALHHARAALAASGQRIEVTRCPDPGDPDLLASIRLIGAGAPTAAAIQHYESLLIPHTARRKVAPTTTSASIVDALRAVVEANGTYLHLVRADERYTLIDATDRAAALEITDPACRAELAAWTHRPAGSDDGVPAAATVPRIEWQRMPLRDLDLPGAGALALGDNDNDVTYAILFARGEDPFSWLRAGEALGATLVSAVEHGVAVSPISHVVAVAQTRETLRRLLAGIGLHPMLVLRIGLVDPVLTVPVTPRRSAADVIETATANGGDS